MPVSSARKLELLLPSTTSSVVSSLLSDPSSSSLALSLSDSSLLLYPPPSSSSSPPTSIPSSAAAAFLRILPSGRLLFLTASPSLLLRAFLLRPPRFLPARLHPLSLDLNPLSLPVRIAGSVNALAVQSRNRIWIMGARLEDEDEDEVRLTKCAVIECSLPIYSMGMSAGFMVLGEVGGVRVFPLRPLIKGRDTKRSGLRSGGAKAVGGGVGAARVEAAGRAQGKLRTAKLVQNSGDYGSFFVGMSHPEVQNSETGIGAFSSLKAVSIHALAQKKFLILDSFGDLHHLNIMEASPSTSNHRMSPFHYIMKVQMLAVLHDITNRKQVIWLSDGGHSLHMMSVGDMESPVSDNGKDEVKEKVAMQITAIEAVFTSDKVQDIVPLSANEVLVLGQGNVYAYANA